MSRLNLSRNVKCLRPVAGKAPFASDVDISFEEPRLGEKDVSEELEVTPDRCKLPEALLEEV